MGQTYFTHRRAYWPRMWRWGIAAGAVVATIVVVFTPPVWACVLIGAAAGGGTGWLRLWAWRRRHPVITIAEHMDDMRDAAPWN